VLEGSLELKLNRSRIKLIKLSFLSAVIPLFMFSFLLAFVFQYLSGYLFKDCLANAIPLGIISSAVAIPTVKRFGTDVKEFVTYESCISDIIGVIFFNFIVLNAHFGYFTFVKFGINFVLELVVSFVASVVLTLLLRKIEHHIKFIPILASVILIYMISTIYHLPPLVFVLLFGLFLSNLNKLKNIKFFRWTRRLKPEDMTDVIFKFKEMTIEIAFLVRAMFFVLFGFLVETSEIINLDTLPWALGIVAGIYLIRFAQLKISHLPINPLLFVAPRGLITIMLFLSINQNSRLPLVNNSLIVQIVIITALIMMVTMITPNKQKEQENV
jgi:hypothetical protein